MKADELVIGKKYYFDDSNDDYGELISNEEKTLTFKPIINNSYPTDFDGMVLFSAIGRWNEVEE